VRGGCWPCVVPVGASRVVTPPNPSSLSSSTQTEQHPEKLLGLSSTNNQPRPALRTVYTLSGHSASSACSGGNASTRSNSAGARRIASGPVPNIRMLFIATSAGGGAPGGGCSSSGGSSSCCGVAASRSRQSMHAVPKKETLAPGWVGDGGSVGGSQVLGGGKWMQVRRVVLCHH